MYTFIVLIDKGNPDGAVKLHGLIDPPIYFCFPLENIRSSSRFGHL
jgi:hypothetical protein